MVTYVTILEDAWNELLDHYRNGHVILNEEDMRCLLYHVCAKRLKNLNEIHCQKRIYETKQEKYDLILGSEEKPDIAVELKCWLWRSSGTAKRDAAIRDQLRRLQDAIDSRRCDKAHLFVLDEFGLPQHLLEDMSPTRKEIQLKYFSAHCMKTNQKWRPREDQEPCQSCTVRIPCQSNQQDIVKWKSKGYLL